MINRKAERLINQRRVRITSHGTDYAAGMVLGDTGLRYVCIDPDGPRCDCPAGLNHRLCSHVVAVGLLLEELDPAAYASITTGASR